MPRKKGKETANGTDAASPKPARRRPQRKKRKPGRKPSAPRKPKKASPRYTLRIQAEVNGRIRRATIFAHDLEGTIKATDKADLVDGAELRRSARRLAEKLQADPATMEANLSAAWAETLDQHRREMEQAKAGSAEAMPPEHPFQGRMGEDGEDVSLCPEIVITTAEYDVNDKAAQALARDSSVFQRGAMLVRLVRDTAPVRGGISRSVAPRIDPLPLALLRERLTACARWRQMRRTAEGDELVPGRPPLWCIAAVGARADWPGVRRLEAVVDHPVLRPDGTVLSTAGYDPETGLLLEMAGDLSAPPESPTHAQAVAARDALLGVVCDFPFDREDHKAAWLAALLTPLARFAFAGPAPLFLVDANTRGSGKGLMLDCIARILTGERFTVATYTSDEDELRKRITSLAISGDRLVLFDNLEGRFGNATLDAALTATHWQDRLLGVNRIVQAPLFVTWYATGNNVAVSADTARRICHVRLESDREHPEERADFRCPDLLAYVALHRGRLLAAALTILRGYCVAGRPNQHLTAWGSFDGWSRLVRAAVVWCGLPDPGQTRQQLQEQADTAASGMNLLLLCWERMDPCRGGLTAAEVVDRLFKHPPLSPPDWYADMRDAIEGLVGRGDSRALGVKLRGNRRRIFGGRFIDRAGLEHSAARWAVFPGECFAQRTGGKHPPHPPPSSPEGSSFGENGEDGEDVSLGAADDLHTAVFVDPFAPDDGRGDAWEGD